MHKLAFSASAIIFAVASVLPTTASALSFQSPSNYSTNERCAKLFDKYVSLSNKIWQIELSDIEKLPSGTRPFTGDPVNLSLAPSLTSKLQKLKARAARIKARMDRHCEY